MERRLLKPKEVEKIYNIDAGTLANWRCQGNASFLIRGNLFLDIFVFL
jgi:hypothetical protein